VNMPLGTVSRIQSGYQEGFSSNLWTAGGNILGLLGVLLVIHFQGTLCWLVLAMAGAPILAVAINGWRLFGWDRPWLRPRWRFASHLAARKVLGMGLLFFILQFAVAAAFSSDNIIAAQILGSAAVTQYSVHARLFSIAPMLLMMAMGPLWPAYSEAIARGDIAWARRTLIRSLVASLVLSGLLSLILVIAGPWLLKIWVGDKVTPVFSLLLGLGVWTVLWSAGNALAMFLNGANVMRFQVITALTMASLAVLLKIVFTQRIGLFGIVLGTIVAYTVAVMIPSLIIVPKKLAVWSQRKQ